MNEARGTIFKGAHGKQLLAITLSLPPLADDSDKSWVQVIPGEGSFAGHADGPFEFTEETVDSIVENFNKRQTPVKCDYEHDSHRDDLTGPKPSSGHVLGLEKRVGDSGAELWAYCEWTKRAAEFIRNNEYNFNSPVIAFEWDDAITGEEQGPTLLSLALTDTPFLDAQQPIQLSLFSARNGATESCMQNVTVAKFLKATGKRDAALLMSAVEALAHAQSKLGPDAGESDVLDAVYDELAKQGQRDVVREVIAEVQGADMPEMPQPPAEEPTSMEGLQPEEEPAAMEEDVPPAPVDASAFFDALSAATGADRAALVAALGELADPIAKMVSDLLDKDESPAEMSQLGSKTPEEGVTPEQRAELEADKRDAEIAALRQTVSALKRKQEKREEAERAERQKANEARIAHLVANGFIKEPKRAWALSWLNDDPERFNAFYADAEAEGRKEVPVRQHQADPETARPEVVQMSDLDAETQHLAKNFIAARVAGGNQQECIQLAQQRVSERRSN